jgi:hypothetical protein
MYLFGHSGTVLNVSDVRHIEVHTAKPGTCRTEVEIAIGKSRKFESQTSDQIPAELIKAGIETLLSGIYKPINSIWNKEELPDQWKESVIVPVHKKVYKTDFG